MSMAEKLGLGSEVRELKIGASFYNNKNAFHTMRYDFKPASVVSGSKHATIEIGPNQQVTVTHLETSGVGQTIFKGSRKPYQKECVLIIDRNTGEITLEKLTTNIQLKKTRPESSSSGSGSGGSSRSGAGGIGPPPSSIDSKKPSPPGRAGNGSISQQSSKGGLRVGSGSASNSLKSPRQSPKQQQQPSPQYPHRNSPLIIHKSPPQVTNLGLSPSPLGAGGVGGGSSGNGTVGGSAGNASGGSLPMIDECNDSSSSSFDIGNPLAFPDLKVASPPTLTSLVSLSAFQEDSQDGTSVSGNGNVNSTGRSHNRSMNAPVGEVGLLSESSSDSSSDSGSSDSDDDDSASNSSRHRQPERQQRRSGNSQNSSVGSRNHHQSQRNHPNHNHMNGHMNGNSTSSMSTFLTDDLQLSESGSDSD